MQYVIGLFNCLETQTPHTHTHTSQISRHTFPQSLKPYIFLACIRNIYFIARFTPQSFLTQNCRFFNESVNLKLLRYLFSSQIYESAFINIFGCVASKSKMFTRCIYEIRIVKLKLCKYMYAYIYF